MPITRLALENSRVLVLFIALLVFGGLITFANFPSAEDPTIQIRNVTVMAPAPGLSAAEVETLIARPIEEAMRDIPEVTDIPPPPCATGQSLISRSPTTQMMWARWSRKSATAPNGSRRTCPISPSAC